MKTSLLWALILSPACSFTVDDVFINQHADAGADASNSGGGDAGHGTGEGNTGDTTGGTNGDSTGYTTGGTNGDSTGYTTGGTNGDSTGYTTGGTNGLACTSDLECGAKELCEPWNQEPWGYCKSLCTDDGTCRSTSFENTLGPTVSNDRHVCFGTLPSTDTQGVPVEDASLFAWDLQNDPVALASGLPSARALFITDELCYFATDRGLMRVSLTGETAPELIGAARGDKLKAWHTAEHIWWNHPVQGAYELWRLARTDGATPERFAEVAAAWETGNSKLVVRFADNQSEIIAAPLDDLAMEAAIAPSQAMEVVDRNTRLVIDEEALYYSWQEPEGNFIRRIDLADPAAPPQTMDVGYPSPHDHLHEFFFDDMLFFWAVPDESETYYQVLREPVDLSAPAVVVAKIANHSSLSLVSNFAVYRAHGEPRLTARPLAAR